MPLTFTAKLALCQRCPTEFVRKIRRRCSNGLILCSSCKREEAYRRRQPKLAAQRSTPQARRRARKYWLRRYGLDPASWLALWRGQGGCCAICKGRLTRKLAVVDHCHTTGRVRGLLCRHCNWALGALGDTPEAIRNLLKYVEALR
jgi:hypothetical protein